MDEKIVIVRGDDWEGCYVDGKLVTQGHSLTIQEIFKILKIDAEFKWADQDILEYNGCLPDNIEDVDFQADCHDRKP